MTETAPKLMRALIGGLGPDWHLENVEIPSAPPSTIRVRVHAAGINRADLYKLQGAYGPAPTAGRYTAGMEFAGVIDTADPAAPELAVGTPVLGVAMGTFADYALTLPGLVLPIPDGISFAEAAALPTGLITEHDALVTQAGFQAGQSVLIVGGTSAVGLVAIQLAAALGAAAVIATTTSDDKRQLLRKAGATMTINTNTDDLVAQVLKATDGHGADVTIDHVGGNVFRHLTAATAIGGIIVNVGRLAGREATIDLDELSFRRQRLYGTTFSVRTPEEITRVVAALDPDVTQAVAQRRVTVPVDSTYSPEDYVDAAERLRINQSTGKVVFDFGDAHTMTISQGSQTP